MGVQFFVKNIVGYMSKANQLTTLVDQLETQLTQSRTTAQNLLQALVNERTSPQSRRSQPN